MAFYNKHIIQVKGEAREKAVLTVSCGAGVIVGALLIWKIVLPFIGCMLQHIWGFLTALL